MSEPNDNATTTTVVASQLVDGKHLSHDEDVGLQLLARSERISFTEEEARRVQWKTDVFILPILCITISLQYLDKVTLSYSAVYGMQKDLNLVGQQYSWASSIYYFGYLVAEPLAAYLITKCHIGRFAAGNILLWGIMVMLCATAKTFAGLMALRFFMGLFEASIAPCWVSLMAMYYRKEEQGLRVTTWYGFVGVAAIIGGLLAYGIGHAKSGVKVWQLIFLVCGGTTVVWSFIVWYFLPADPTSARFFNERERLVAVERLRTNRTGVKSSRFKINHALEALTDPQCIIIALWSGISNITNIAGTFLPLIIQDMGFSEFQTTLLTLPVGGVEIVAMIIAGFTSSYIKNGRTIIMFVVALPTLVGIALLDQLSLEHRWARVASVWMVLCIPASYAIMLSLISSNVAGTSKRLITTCASLVVFCVGNIVSPQLFRAEEAPHYRTATRVMLVAVSACQILTIMLGAYYIWQNQRRDRLLEELPANMSAETVENEEFMDRTDREDWVKFRYRW
ncbi:dipeptide transmembrane transporter [Xylariaceae sp. FL0016]|nr:dipeptide transmembrane transporter [Xylariaceae sp. FL0016]